MNSRWTQPASVQVLGAKKKHIQSYLHGMESHPGDSRGDKPNTILYSRLALLSLILLNPAKPFQTTVYSNLPASPATSSENNDMTRPFVMESSVMSD